MDQNKPITDTTNSAPSAPVAANASAEVFKLGGDEKKKSILGSLLGDKFKGFAQKTGGGSLLGAAIGAQIADEKKQAAQNQNVSIASLLGGAPTFDPAALEADRRKHEKRAKFAFYGAVAFAIAIFGYFQVNLNPNVTILSPQIGPNVAAQFEEGNNLIKKVQTDINTVQYRIARMWLDVINQKVDAFTSALAATKNEKATLTERTAAQQNADALAAELKQALGAVKSILSQNLGVDTYTAMPVSSEEREAEYKKLLTDSLTSERDTLRGSAASAKEKEQVTKDTRVVEGVLRLVGNKRIRSIILSSPDFKTIDNEKLAEVISQVRAEGLDEFAQVEKLKKERIDWGVLISNIHQVVSSADPQYGYGFFKSRGGFMFSQYSFNAKTNRVTITGVTRTTDSKTFSFISILVDAIEKSPYFKDIDFRSFNKSRDESGDFSSSINLEFALEDPVTE